jgi:hypothetical protein
MVENVDLLCEVSIVARETPDFEFAGTLQTRASAQLLLLSAGCSEQI